MAGEDTISLLENGISEIPQEGYINTALIDTR